MVEDLVCRDVAVGDWPRVAARFSDLTFEQTAAYAGAAARRIGGETRFLVLEDAGGIVAAAALRLKTVPGLGRGIAWIPSGPLLCPKDAAPPDPVRVGRVLSALRARLVDGEGHILRLRLAGTAVDVMDALPGCAEAAGFQMTGRVRSYRSIAIDLRKSPEALLQDLNGKWRTDLRFAQKSDLRLDRGQGPAFEARFMALFGVVQEAKGFSPDITPEFHFALPQGDYQGDYAVETLIVTKDGQDIAGIVTGTAGPCVTYLFGATAAAGRPLRAGYFLTWEALRLAQDRGALWYDLGGVDAAENPDVARFKERMNGVPIRSDVWQAQPGGAWSGGRARLILALEALRSRMKKR